MALPTPRPRPNHVLTFDEIDALDEREIRRGVMYAGWCMGSHSYYIQDEIDRCLEERDGIHAFFDRPYPTALYIYWRQERVAERRAARAAAQR